MIKRKRGVATEKGFLTIILFIILFAIAVGIIFWMRSGSENTNAVIAAIENLFTIG